MVAEAEAEHERRAGERDRGAVAPPGEREAQDERGEEQVQAVGRRPGRIGPDRLNGAQNEYRSASVTFRPTTPRYVRTP